jgi:hypothetical protein
LEDLYGLRERVNGESVVIKYWDYRFMVVSESMRGFERGFSLLSITIKGREVLLTYRFPRLIKNIRCSLVILVLQCCGYFTTFSLCLFGYILGS